jgi:cyclophilin family peptidyl-prolyl cis-trans isomerase
MRKLMLATFVLLFFAAFYTAAPVEAAIDLDKANYGVDVYVGGAQIEFPDQLPLIDAATGRTYVPLRFVSEAFGCAVKWDQEKQVIVVTKDQLSIYLSIGEAVALVEEQGNSRLISIAAPELVNNRTMVPLRFMSEVVGTQVNFTPAAGGVNSRVDIDEKAAPETPVADIMNYTLETTKGKIVVEVYPKMMPVTAGNFDKLVKADFYNGLTFHRVEDWVVQGGDPQGNGQGGPGWTIPLEVSLTLKNLRGTLAMARSNAPDSAGSQFYILKNDASWLDGNYAVFGKVVEGLEVVDKIEKGDKIISIN